MAHYRDSALAVVQRGGFAHVLEKGASLALFDLLLRDNAGFRSALMALIPRAFMETGLTRRRLEGMLYLNIGHTGLDRSGHARWVRRTGVRAIYYVHDLIPITHPRFARAGEPKKHAARMETVLRHGTGIIANSEDSLNQLRLFAGARHLPVPPSLRAPLGLEFFASKAVVTSPPMAGPYFVVLGTIEGRKNHALLLDVWRQLARRQSDNLPRLVIIGQRGWSAEDVLAALDTDETLRPFVTELGRCSDDELRRWLAHARALLFPSFVEGQGLPLMEALASGTPALASDLAVFRETAGDIPEYLDPCCLGQWVDRVTEYARPDSLARSAQLERMEHYVPPSWEGHFKTVQSWLSGKGI